MRQAQAPRLGQQGVRVPGKGRHHRHHLSPCPDMAVDGGGDARRILRPAQDRASEFQHHDLCTLGRRLRFGGVGDEGEAG